VREITPALTREKYALRQLLEVYAMRQAARSCTERDLLTLRAHCQEMEQAVATRNLEGFYITQYDLHRAIVHMAGMETLTRMWDLVGASIGSLMMLNLYYTNSSLPSADDFWESNTTATSIAASHLELLAPLAAHEEERAAAMMHEHLLVGERSVLLALERARQRHASQR
jgi:DNA-binding GntR family transcriptional regulator